MTNSEQTEKATYAHKNKANEALKYINGKEKVHVSHVGKATGNPVGR